MQLSGTYTFEADQGTIWNLLMDPQAIANALPGVEELIPVEGEVDSWKADARLKVGSISGSYSGIVRMTEKSPPDRYRLTVEGEGQQSIIRGSALISLSYDTETQKTNLKWDAEADLTGKLAQVGQRVVNATANMMSKRFFDALADQLPPREEGVPASEVTGQAISSNETVGLSSQIMELLARLFGRRN